MKRLILLSTASALRFIARQPVGLAEKLADAADWLEERAQTWHPVEDAELRFRIVPSEFHFEDWLGENAKSDRIADLYNRLLRGLMFYEPDGELYFDLATNTLKIPPFRLCPAFQVLIDSGVVKRVNVDLKSDQRLIQNFHSEAWKIMGFGK